MSINQEIANHYTNGSLLDTIHSALGVIGKTTDTITVDDLAPVDEFHIGGRAASEGFLGQLGLTPDTHVLDIGCGIGGPARFAAQRFGCKVTGIDLTEEFVETGNELTKWVGLADRISLHQGSALSMPFEAQSFDGAYLFHVGMNIADKAALFAETSRMLPAGAVFGVFDIMQVGDGKLTFPVPWASTPEQSAVASLAEYKTLLGVAGFEIVGERNRTDFALDFFAKLVARSAGGPPPLGLHLMMGASIKQKIPNMVAGFAARHIAPVELICRKV